MKQVPIPAGFIGVKINGAATLRYFILRSRLNCPDYMANRIKPSLLAAAPQKAKIALGEGNFGKY